MQELRPVPCIAATAMFDSSLFAGEAAMKFPEMAARGASVNAASAMSDDTDAAGLFGAKSLWITQVIPLHEIE